MNWMDKLERKDRKICSSESDVVHYHHVWTGYVLYLINPAFLCTVSLPECTGNSARTGLEDHYIYHSASVIQSDLDAGGIISLLFYRERTGTGMGDFPF